MSQNIEQKQGVSYKDAGVDIDAGNALIDKIKPFAKATARIGADSALGGFGGLFDMKATGYKDPILVSATDGVGTKLKLAFTMDKHDTVGIDLVAMCVNDLVVQGAEPLFFLDYFATGGLEVEKAANVIKGIAEGCKQAGCALVGGETAEMPGMYPKGEYDLAGFSVGAVERGAVLPRSDISEGDVVLGLASSGVHSNGFSLIRHIISHAGLNFDSPAPFASGKKLGEVLLTPTKIYVKSCLKAIAAGGVKALSHITGGGLLENLPRVYGEELAAEVKRGSWNVLPVFKWLQEAGNVAEEEMLRTFNMGVGMVLIVEATKAEQVKAALEAEGEAVAILGQMVKREAGKPGVVLR